MAEAQGLELLISLLQSSDLEAITELLRQQPDMANLRDEFGYTAVVYAMSSSGGCPDALPLLAAAGADLNVRTGEGGLTPLCMAVEHALYYGDLQAIRLLLAHGADPNQVDGYGLTPIGYTLGGIGPSSSPGCVDILDLLLQSGADPNHLDSCGYSPLDFAYRLGDGRAVRLLLAQGARLQTVADAEEGGVVLSLAAFRNGGGDPAVAVDALLASGIDINARDSYGRIALHAAVLTGDAVMVAYLLARGADPNAREDAVDDIPGQEGPVIHPRAGRTPLHLAAYEGHPELVRLLLGAGADKDASGGPGIGGSPLINATNGAIDNRRNREDAHETIRMLLEQGVDIRPTGMYKQRVGGWGVMYHLPCALPCTALSVATMLGQSDVVALLLDYGVGRQPEELVGAMMTATWDNGYEHLPALWAAGRKLTPPLRLVDVLPHVEDTALSVLLGEHRDIDIIEPLGAAVLNEADPDTGETPLLWLLRNLSEEGEWRQRPYDELRSPCYDTVSLLLKHGADPNIRDHRGQSALDVAREQNLPHCVALLQQYGAGEK